MQRNAQLWQSSQERWEILHKGTYHREEERSKLERRTVHDFKKENTDNRKKRKIEKKGRKKWAWLLGVHLFVLI